MGKLQQLDKYVRTAVSFYWKTREKQASAQLSKEVKDTGLRTAVTGGKQMDGFVALLCDLIQEAGVPLTSIHFRSRIDLPGYFRPTKKWDLIVVHERKLIVVVECKSQVGPSFGNNFNNRTEEAMGSALDLWTAFKNGKFNSAVRPWLGYAFADTGDYTEPALDLRYEVLARSLVGHCAAASGKIAEL